MFKIMTKWLNTPSLRLLSKLWNLMLDEMSKPEYCGKDCDNCKYKRLCTALRSSEEYLHDALNDRGTTIE